VPWPSKPEAFCVRFAAACGYFAEVTHYVASGRIGRVTTLTRARPTVGEDGSFTDARFELEDRSVRMLFDEHSWAWNDNPFVGTPQLDGLKIVVMPGFVAGVHDGVVDFGYQGQRSEIGRGIPVAHVRWFYRKVRRITEPALRKGLLASGATDDEAARLARSLMMRIEALGRVR
jgi:hypothetical protein